MRTVVNTDRREDPLDDVGCRVFAESLPHMVWVEGRDSGTEYFNTRAANYFGIPARDDGGWSWLGLVHPDDAELVRSAWGASPPDGVDSVTHVRMRRADGAYRWVSARGSTIGDPRGAVTRRVATFTDIDEHKRLEVSLVRAERQTAEALALLDTLQSTAPVGFVFLDRDFRYVRVNEKAAEINGVPIAGHLGRTPAEVIPTLWPQVESTYRAVMERGEELVNVEVTGMTVAEPGRVRTWLTSNYAVRVEGSVIGLGVVFVDITDRKEAEQAQRALTERAVRAIVATVEARDPYTAGHQRRVAELAAAIAAEMGLDGEAVEGIRMAANIHDIGKIGVPAEILSRPGRLRAAEYELVKGHSRAGYEIIEGIDFGWPVAQMVLQHHERLDGSGYPDGLHGDEILIGSRIVAVADVVEAMATHRPYRAALGVEAALRELTGNRGRLYDAEVVDACLRLFADGRADIGQRPADEG